MIKIKNFEVYSDKLIVAEDDKGNLLIDFVLCDFETNGNGKKINRENAEEKIKTLLNMPLVGRIRNENGVMDFTGHNQKKKYVKEGNDLKVKTYLDTEAIGTFVDINISEIEEKEYICAKALLWGRFENAKNIILERFSRGEPIKSSWELVITDSHSEIENSKPIEVIDDFYFIGNCVLGEKVQPAYRCAGVKELQVAEEIKNYDEELSSAIAQDINNLNIERRDLMENNKANEVLETSQEPEKETIEVSALTLGDIRRKVSKLIYQIEKEEDYWLYDSIIYPLENTAYFSKEGSDNLEEDYLKVVYSIDDKGEVSIVSKEDVKMTFVPKENVVEVSEFEKVKTELSEKVDSIVKLGETIKEKDLLVSEKDKEISELQIFKDQVAEIQRVQAEKELEEKRLACKETVLSSKYLTEDDIETSEDLKQAIYNCDENKIKILIAEAVLKTNIKEDVEVSEVSKNQKESYLDLNSTNKYDYPNEITNPILSAIRSSKR